MRKYYCVSSNIFSVFFNVVCSSLKANVDDEITGFTVFFLNLSHFFLFYGQCLNFVTSQVQWQNVKDSVCISDSK